MKVKKTHLVEMNTRVRPKLGDKERSDAFLSGEVIEVSKDELESLNKKRIYAEIVEDNNGGNISKETKVRDTPAD